LTLKIGKSSRFCHDCKIILGTSLFFVWVKVEEFFVWLSKKIGLIEKIFLSFLDGKLFLAEKGGTDYDISTRRKINLLSAANHRHTETTAKYPPAWRRLSAIAIGNKERRTVLISSHGSIACSRNSKDSSRLS
jgi:hypothetical protein